MAKQKFYVVWNGTEDGVYTSWEACKEAVEGFSGAKYQAFKTEAEAEEAFEMGYEAWKEHEKELGMRNEELGIGTNSATERTIPKSSESISHSSWRVSSYRQGDIPLWSNVGHQQHRGVPCHCAWSCIAETERVTHHAHLQ